MDRIRKSKPLRAWLRAGGHEYFVLHHPAQVEQAVNALGRWADDPRLTLTHWPVRCFIKASKEIEAAK